MELAKWSKFCITEFFLLLCTHGIVLLGDRCSPSLTFPGYTVPEGDIIIEYGNTLEIMCVLNNNTLNSTSLDPNASQHLSFRRNNQTFPKEMYEIVNSTAIRLHIEKPEKVSNDNYLCLYNETLVCQNLVSVGVSPQTVEDFQCIGYNYESLVCSWTPPQNYIKTNYNLTYQVNSRASRLPMKCPLIKESGENTKDHKMSCYWNISTTPFYRQSHDTFYFTLNMTNKFGTKFFRNDFKHFSHVLSGPPENLTVLSATPSSIYLHWEVPHPMAQIPDGLHHRVLYSCDYGNREFQQAALIVDNAREKSKYFNLTNIKHPHSLCTIKVSIRTAKALPSDEKMWSESKTITSWTLSRAPDQPPYVTPGSFEVSGNDLQYKDFFVYWGEIPESEKNGDNFRYEIRNENEVRYEPGEKSYVVFKLPVNVDHTFYIRSQNDNGSSEPAVLVIPKQISRIDPPTGFNKVDFENGTFELTWDPLKLKNGEELTNYTIFWCKNQKERPSQCSGHLKWKHVPATATSTTVTVDKFKVYQFAISANTHNSTSGLLWGDCTIMFNKNTGKMQNVDITKQGSTYIEIEWKRDCSDRIGPVRGYRIDYCQIKSKYDSDCLGGLQRNLTFSADPSINKANLTNLSPYTNYMLTITAILIKHNSSSQPSKALYAETIEAAPSVPQNLNILNVTNSTVTLSWNPSVKMNGNFKNYMIEYQNKFNAVSLIETTSDTKVTLSNLESYTNYSLKVRACNDEFCSNFSKPLEVTTKMGLPDKIDKAPAVGNRTNSMMTIVWNPPYRSRGKLDYYVVSLEKLYSREKKTVEFNVTEPSYEFKDCGDGGKYNDFTVKVRAVNIVEDQLWTGPWSDKMHNVCENRFNYLLFSLIIVVIVFFVAMAFLFNRLYHHCKIMRDVEVKLPPGLAVVQEHALVLSWNNDIPEKPESHSPPDEELLLIKMTDIGQFSGDSSGCSSGHESVASSLEAGTHISSTSDSGTEQPTSYCTLGTTDLKIDPSDECDDNSESSPYVMSGETVKPIKTINPGYVAFDQTEPKVKSPTGYVVAGHKTCNGYVVAGVKNVKVD